MPSPKRTSTRDRVRAFALAMAPGAEPTGYGLGKSGWVNIPFKRGAPPVGVLTDWVEESYRLVAARPCGRNA